MVFLVLSVEPVIPQTLMCIESMDEATSSEYHQLFTFGFMSLTKEGFGLFHTYMQVAGRIKRVIPWPIKITPETKKLAKTLSGLPSHPLCTSSVSNFKLVFLCEHEGIQLPSIKWKTSKFTYTHSLHHWDRVSLLYFRLAYNSVYRSGSSQVHFPAQTPKCGDCRFMPPCWAHFFITSF